MLGAHARQIDRQKGKTRRLYSVFRKNTPLLFYLRVKCLDFHEVFRKCLSRSKYFISVKKLNIFATGDVMLMSGQWTNN